MQLINGHELLGMELNLLIDLDIRQLSMNTPCLFLVGGMVTIHLMTYTNLVLVKYLICFYLLFSIKLLV